MEIPPDVNLEGHEFLSLLTSHTFTAAEPPAQSSARSANGSLNTSHLDKTLHKSLVSHTKAVCAESVHLQEQVGDIAGAGPRAPSLLLSSSPNPAEDRCSNASVAQRRSDHVQTDDLNFAASNGDVLRPPTDPRRQFAAPRLDGPRIVKHNLSSITFSDYSPTTRADGSSCANGSSDDGDSSLEEEEEDRDDDEDEEEEDDDVFLGLRPARNRCDSKVNQKRRDARTELDPTANNSGSEAEVILQYM